MALFSRNYRRVSNRPRHMGGNRVVTRSGRILRVNSSLGGRLAQYKAGKAKRKVDRMRGLPKSRVKRLAWRLNPRRQAEYWFSRDGAVTAIKILGIAIFLFFVLTIGIFAFFRKNINNLAAQANTTLGGSLAFYDRTNTYFLGQDYDKVKRVPVQSDQISNYMKEATVAVEDRNFYNNHGFDVKGVVRAAINDVFHHGSVQGGSTITEQVVKQDEGWQQQRNISTKIKELILAVELERQYTKDEILTQYLNLSPYGGLDYGVQVAAQDYFHVNASQLTLSESAMLAAIPKSPSVYSPYDQLYFDKQAFLDRYNYVLDSMAQTGKITKAQATAAKKVNILAKVHKQQSKFAGQLAPYFIQAAENQIEKQFTTNGPNTQNTGPLRIITSLDMKIQKLTEQKVAANVANLKAHNGDETASVVEDVQTGQYLAEVGGLDFNQPGYGQINFAQWPISPGSSFKPYDYSTLIQNHNNAGAGSVLYDSIGPVPGYPCTNHSSPTSGGNCLHDFTTSQPGPMTLRYALGGSRNIPAVKAMAEAVPGASTQDSVNKVIDTAQRFMNNGANYSCYKDGSDVTLEQSKDRKPCYTSSAIGDGAFLHLDNHLNGLSSLGRLGLSIPSTYILKIQDSSGKTIYQWKQPVKGDTGVDQVVDPQTAYILDNMLSDPNASYFSPFGPYAKFQHYNGWNIAVKTGTTNSSFDGLMMAWTTKYAVGTWVGYHTRQVPLLGEMENITMPVTRDVIEGALNMSHAKPSNWAQPAGIQHLPAFISRTAYSSQLSPPSTDIYPSWYVQPGNTKAQTIDKVSNKLATSCTPPLARQTVGGSYAANKFSIDIFYGAGAMASNSSLKANDDVHSCSDTKPAITLTISDNGNNTYTITGAASAGTHPLTDSTYAQFPGTIHLSVAGKVIKTCEPLPATAGNCSVTYKPSSSGSQTVSAQVIDSVLYDSTASKSFSFKAATKPISGVTAKKNATDIAISWSGSAGPYTVTDTSQGLTLCSGVGSTSCSDSKPSDVAHVQPGDSVTVSGSSGSGTGTVN